MEEDAREKMLEVHEEETSEEMRQNDGKTEKN